MQFWCVLVCSGGFFVGSGGSPVSSDVVLVCFGMLLVGSGEFWWVQVGSGAFWCSFGGFWLGSCGFW